MKLLKLSFGILFVTIHPSQCVDSATESLLKDSEKRELLIKLVQRGLKPNFKMTMEELRELEKESSKDHGVEERDYEEEDVQEL
jgi:hypothetical protein